MAAIEVSQTSNAKGESVEENPKGTVRLSVNLTREAAESLRQLADLKGTTMTEVLKSAIGAEKFLVEAKVRGDKILREGKDGKIRELVFK